LQRLPGFPHAPILSALTFAFALRVAGQAIQRWLPRPFLPPFAQWQGSSTPYSVLLLLQLLILGLMVRTSWRVARGVSVPSRRLGKQLAWFGGVYMTVSLVRIAVGLALPSAPAWFTAWISGAFHIVLAAFVLTAAHYHLRPAVVLK
jgi:hypothetical protein